ncbi:hypothetical protein CPY53_07265 [Paenibacillus polymyxa]|uniref:NB-ARC domain-containing protein n=1 Tax=Paenibacillus polymyxa TaxID=1406 RepID=UPI001F578A09|nr:NB-ARC domain-containing protein [Paenibacillus polymyxa]UNL93385.1 hypothetical protein CPY53_07265 [Paenibacillus polymyxa]
MFLIPKKINELDYILNCFEVAYRSVIAEIIIENFPDESKFEMKINELSKIYTTPRDGIVPAQFLKYSSKINKYKPKKKIYELYKILDFCYKSLKNQDYWNTDVPYVSQLTELVLIFYKPLFENLGKAFGRIEDYEDNLLNYLTIRNAASHPASSKISILDTEEVIKFIISSLDLIDRKYYWYVSKDEIYDACKKLLDSLKDQEVIKHNLFVISKKHKNLIERDNELQTLKKYILGEGKIKRTSGSVVLHGSGGVGKTALALEFTYDLVIESLDNPQKSFDFIFWLSSKEEELVYHKSMGDLQISKLNPQFETLRDIIQSMCKFLKLGDIKEEELLEYLDTKKGIIVLDNYETISHSEKELINNFIRMCPRSIHFIITSRIIESIAEDSIPLLGFEENNGKVFVERYCQDNFYYENFSSHDLRVFIKEACGNPLVMVLSLGRIIDGLANMSEIIHHLKNYASSDVEVLTDFMYKNMFEEIIVALSEKKNCDVGNILNIMLLYDAPIDLYSLKDLTKINTKELEDILGILGNKLVISKHRGFYVLNELAIKFALIRTLPNSIGIKSLLNEIDDYKRSIDEHLTRLEKDKKMFPDLQAIIDDWKPISQPESIAMAQSYTVHATINSKLIDNPQIDYVQSLYRQIKQEFEIIKQRSNHPYIKFQQARVLKLLLKYRKLLSSNGLLAEVNTFIKLAFSDAYTEIWIRYRHILETRSYPKFLIQYASFLIEEEPKESFKLLEKCTETYENFLKDEINYWYNSHYYLVQTAVMISLKKEVNELLFLKVGEKSIERCQIIASSAKPKSQMKILQLKDKSRVLKLCHVYIMLKTMRNTNKYELRKIYISCRDTWVPPYFRKMKTEIESMLFQKN